MLWKAEVFYIWLDFYSFIHLINIMYHPYVRDTGEWHMKKTDATLAVMEPSFLTGSFVKCFDICKQLTGSISRLVSDLSEEWKTVTCSYLRRVSWGYVRHNKEWVDYNGTKAISAPSTELRKKFSPCQAGPHLDGAGDLDGWGSRSHPASGTTVLPSLCQSIIMACLEQNYILHGGKQNL